VPKRISSGLAHRFLACPQSQEVTAARLFVERGHRRALARGHELARQPVGIDRAILAPMSTPMRAPGGNPAAMPISATLSVCDTLKSSASSCDFGTAASAATQRNRCGIDAEGRAEQPAQCCATGDPARSQRRCAEAIRALDFRR
jgi:hypothetical protein